MKKLRLLITEDCDRACAGCCNKDWDLDALPKCIDFSPYDVVMLTGGEPLLYPDEVIRIAKTVREHNRHAQVILYTAWSARVLHVLPWLDGVTLTLHDYGDEGPFKNLQATLRDLHLVHTPWVLSASMRLNVFKNVKIKDWYIASWWKVQKDMYWVKDAELPKGEVFMRCGL